jgi:hypothetical protein
LVTYVEAGEPRRNLDTTALRKLLLDAMQVPMIDGRREAAKAIKEEEAKVPVV